MINREEYRQLKAFARQDGFLMGLLWVVSFACFIGVYAYRMPALMMLFYITLPAIPVTLYFMTKRYRDKIIGGHMTFLRGLSYSFSICIYAILIFALGQWLYFQFIDDGKFLGGIQALFSTPEYKQAVEQSGVDMTMFNEAINEIAAYRPIDIALSCISNNVIMSLVMCLVMAALCKRK